MEKVEKILKRRMEENKKLFSRKELNMINKTHAKIYMLGLIDGKKTYN